MAAGSAANASTRAEPSPDGSAPTAQAARSVADRPMRRAVPITEPAEVPTMTSARAGVPPEVHLEGGEHACVVGLPDDPARPEDEPDAAWRHRPLVIDRCR